MTAVPSFIAKVSRAKKHLVELDEAIKNFSDTHPYTVRERIEGKKERKVRRIAFTSDPANTDIPIIAADVIYNLRSSLDHLMSALVAKKDRGSAIFPIFFQGVWEAIVPGENQQRVKERMRWASGVKTVSDDAVAVLKLLQPADTGPQDPEPALLRLLNSLSNRDRHEKLPVIASGIGRVRMLAFQPDGTVRSGSASPNPDHVLENETEILDLPTATVKVEIEGTALVGILLGTDKTKRYVGLPDGLRTITEQIEGEIIPRLAPYVQPR